MSYDTDSYQNTTGLTKAPPTQNDKMSGISVIVHEGRNAEVFEVFELTEPQEAFAQKIAKTGEWEEMPHKSGRRQIRQRVLDIIKGATTSTGAPKARSKSDRPQYIWVVRRGSEILGVRNLKSEAKQLCQDASGSIPELTWINNQKRSANTKDGEFFVQELLVPKRKSD